MISNAQYSEFSKGYPAGYKNGYCYSSTPGIYCNPPVFIPNAPNPVYPESYKSWSDGYNRGFIDGFEKRKNDEKIKSKVSNPPITKFNPYIPQNPIAYMSPSELMTYNNSINNRGNGSSELLESLVGKIYDYRNNNYDKLQKIKMEREYRKFSEYKNKKLSKAKSAKKIEKYTDAFLYKKYKNKTKTIKIFGWTISVASLIVLLPTLIQFIEHV
jgi:hypothetical protein